MISFFIIYFTIKQICYFYFYSHTYFQEKLNIIKNKEYQKINKKLNNFILKKLLTVITKTHEPLRMIIAIIVFPKEYEPFVAFGQEFRKSLYILDLYSLEGKFL